MTTNQLQQIKSAYDQLQGGISNPVKINEAYQQLPNMVEGSPMIAKIRAITRFMMLNYHDYLKIVDSPVEAIPVSQEDITESIGTIENKPKQSHQENLYNPDGSIMDFLTVEEQQDLKSKKAGTEFVVKKAPVKRRPAKKNLNNTK